MVDALRGALRMLSLHKSPSIWPSSQSEIWDFQTALKARLCVSPFPNCFLKPSLWQDVANK